MSRYNGRVFILPAFPNTCSKHVFFWNSLDKVTKIGIVRITCYRETKGRMVTEYGVQLGANNELCLLNSRSRFMLQSNRNVWSLQICQICLNPVVWLEDSKFDHETDRGPNWWLDWSCTHLNSPITDFMDGPLTWFRYCWTSHLPCLS